jgi:predicted transport protein
MLDTRILNIKYLKQIEEEYERGQYLACLCLMQAARDYLKSQGVREGQTCRVTLESGEQLVGVFLIETPEEAAWLEYEAGYIPYMYLYESTEYKKVLATFNLLAGYFDDEYAIADLTGFREIKSIELLKQTKEEPKEELQETDTCLLDTVTVLTGTDAEKEHSKKRAKYLEERAEEEKRLEVEKKLKEKEIEKQLGVQEALLRYIRSLGKDIEELNGKTTTTFRLGGKPFIRVWLKTSKNPYLKAHLALWLSPVPEVSFIRDVGHCDYITGGNIELRINNKDDLEQAKPLIDLTYNNFKKNNTQD